MLKRISSFRSNRLPAIGSVPRVQMWLQGASTVSRSRNPLFLPDGPSSLEIACATTLVRRTIALSATETRLALRGFRQLRERR